MDRKGADGIQVEVQHHNQEENYESRESTRMKIRR